MHFVRPSRNKAAKHSVKTGHGNTVEDHPGACSRSVGHPFENNVTRAGRTRIKWIIPALAVALIGAWLAYLKLESDSTPAPVVSHIEKSPAAHIPAGINPIQMFFNH